MACLIYCNHTMTTISRPTTASVSLMSVSNKNLCQLESTLNCICAMASVGWLGLFVVSHPASVVRAATLKLLLDDLFFFQSVRTKLMTESVAHQGRRSPRVGSFLHRL